MSTWAAEAFRRGGRWVDRLERSVLTLLVTGMVFLAALQILLRNVWKTGLPWAEPLLGMALLWLTMLGALAATGLGRHLSIDLAHVLLPRRWSSRITRLTSLFAVVVCVLLAWAAGRYVGFQRDMAMGELLGQPYWKYYMVIPVTLWIMAIRFTIRAVVPTAWLPGRIEDGPPGGGREPS